MTNSRGRRTASVLNALAAVAVALLLSSCATAGTAADTRDATADIQSATGSSTFTTVLPTSSIQATDPTAPVASYSQHPVVPQTTGPSVSPTKTAALTPEQALARAMSGVDKGLFVSAEFTPPRSGLPAQRGFAAVTRAASGKNGDPMLGEWEGDLVADAVAELLTPSGPISASIGEVMESAVGPDGHVVDAGYGFPISPDLAGTVFPAAALSDGQIIANLRHSAEDAGLEVDSIRVLHPLDPAPIVVLRLSAPDEFTLDDYTELLQSLFGLGPNLDASDYDGYYLELDSHDGARLVITDAAARGGPGAEWESPDAPFRFPSASPAPTPPKVRATSSHRTH